MIKLPLVIKTMGVVPLNVVLSTNVCLFLNNSGAGKTLFFSLLQAYCSASQIKMLLINLKNYPTDEQMLNSYVSLANESYDIIVLDNADLYDVDTFVHRLNASDKLVLVAGHNIKVSASNLGHYRVKMGDTGLHVARYGGLWR